MKKNLSLKTVAELLGCSTRTIYRLVWEGELTSFKVRGSLRIPEESLESYRKRQILRYAEENGISLSDDDSL
jgi:excisionase family DNA binding protein